ncbi:MAG TPA: glycoside hydrolase family 3 protein [Polyangiaceae bacterium]|nr:glycoside hydrolase family 3 protein [Polyangiaceae bacterium]
MATTWNEKAAELICVGIGAAHLDDPTRALLDLGVSGVLIGDATFAGPSEVYELITSIRRHAGRPLFIAIDHEGAARSRLQSGFTRLPALRALGDTGDEDYAYEVGRVLGRELRAVGVDLCLGPVLDVATNPNNPVIGERSLGTDPLLVARLGTRLARGLQDEGVGACVKHFPGHGDTVTDSNLALPILPHGVVRLEEVELQPFVAAVEARVAAMLVGHILFRALDSKFPASLSRPILFGLLRQKLAYRGLVLTDDVDMGALTRHFTPAEIAEHGIAAGADCFLCARQPETARQLINAMVEGLDRGNILPERVEAARRRVSAFVHRYAPGPHDGHLESIGSAENAQLLGRIGGGRPSLFDIG